ncbi:MAG: hypothetical protein GY793_10120 [Proteobacteria bacterium]|nr:hypothetical protein [Pseudomonadota bacterium]
MDKIVEEVKKEYDVRSCIGVEKYKTTLQDNNKDDFLQHLKEELMDAVLYLQKIQSQENKGLELHEYGTKYYEDELVLLEAVFVDDVVSFINYKDKLRETNECFDNDSWIYRVSKDFPTALDEVPKENYEIIVKFIKQIQNGSTRKD